MKYLTIILSVFTFMSCDNSKQLAAKENTHKGIEDLSGKYYIISVNETDYSLNELTLQFDTDTKTVSGFSGCNRFSGTYTLEGNFITFGPLASTRMACQEDKNQMEHKMLTALSSVNTFSLKGQELIFFSNESIVLKATKSSEEKITQNNNYKIEYTAITRGFYNAYVFENGKISIKKDRTSTPTIKTLSKEQTQELLEELKALDLEKLKTLEAPTEKRFVDAAAIATITISHLGETYQTPEFDNGEPNKYIAPLVATLLKLAENQ